MSQHSKFFILKEIQVAQWSQVLKYLKRLVSLIFLFFFPFLYLSGVHWRVYPCWNLSLWMMRDGNFIHETQYDPAKSAKKTVVSVPHVKHIGFICLIMYSPQPFCQSSVIILLWFLVNGFTSDHIKNSSLLRYFSNGDYIGAYCGDSWTSIAFRVCD